MTLKKPLKLVILACAGTVRAAITGLFLLLASIAVAQQSPPIDFPDYRNKDAIAGKALYSRYCIACHGADLAMSEFAPPLVGDGFYGRWGEKTVASLLDYIQQQMPLGNAGIMSAEQYEQVLSYMFQKTGFPASDKKLSTGLNRLLPAPASGLIKDEVIDVPPHPNPRPNPLDNITPVTRDMLVNPPDSDWLMWRRTYDSKGYSPLKQITLGNVNRLKLAWSWALPAGRTVTTPLVHDGVMFMYAANDEVHALDATTGDILWRYEGRPQTQSKRYAARSIAIVGKHLFAPTNDGHMLALDVRTGQVVWDKALVDPSVHAFQAGPLFADGYLLMGVKAKDQVPFILALDSKNGEEVWRFNTVAQPGEPGGDTWLGANQGTGGVGGVSAWIPGSYDPETKLAFFGTGNTYSEDILRNMRKRNASGALINQAKRLYMNATLALDARTGKLAWYFQHLPNDHWNYDEAFERTLLTLPVKGRQQKLVVTGGKLGIFDALAIKDGAYAFSVDLGLQKVVESIDAQTGARNIVAATVPSDTESRFVCPHFGGVRSWRPTAFNDDTHTLYSTFQEVCGKITPSEPIIFGGSNVTAYPYPDSDGNFGGLKAIDLQTGETQWTVRQRGLQSTGVLATAGGLVFSGNLDRMFSAYHAQTGKELWHTRLSGIPSGSPISYSVGGKQFIAVVSGEEPGITKNFAKVVAPEIQHSRKIHPAIWVFELAGGNDE